jgi:hypothetical protein
MRRPTSRSLFQNSLVRLSQRSSRRGFLSRVGKYAIGAAGFAGLADQFHHPTEVRAADAHCSPCQWCGLCGKPCSSCGGTSDSCPDGDYENGFFWSACCCPIGGSQGFLYRYKDCCKRRNAQGQCPECSVDKCINNCPTGTWCTASHPCYWCTIAVAVDAC